MSVLEAGKKQSDLRVERVTELRDFEQCVEIQFAVWGYSDGDLIPKRVFVVASAIGGQVIGGFDGERMVGFAMSLPGYREGNPYLHSHMLAVLPEYRNHGLGRMLKLAQRDDAIAPDAGALELVERGRQRVARPRHGDQPVLLTGSGAERVIAPDLFAIQDGTKRQMLACLEHEAFTQLRRYFETNRIRLTGFGHDFGDAKRVEMLGHGTRLIYHFASG